MFWPCPLEPLFTSEAGRNPGSQLRESVPPDTWLSLRSRRSDGPLSRRPRSPSRFGLAPAFPEVTASREGSASYGLRFASASSGRGPCGVSGFARPSGRLTGKGQRTSVGSSCPGNRAQRPNGEPLRPDRRARCPAVGAWSRSVAAKTLSAGAPMSGNGAWGRNGGPCCPDVATQGRNDEPLWSDRGPRCLKILP